MNASHTDDNPRAAGYLFRMSRADRKRLKRNAEERGLTIQGYLENLVFGYDGAPREPGRPRHDREQAAFDLTSPDEGAILQRTG